MGAHDERGEEERQGGVYKETDSRVEAVEVRGRKARKRRRRVPEDDDL